MLWFVFSLRTHFISSFRLKQNVLHDRRNLTIILAEFLPKISRILGPFKTRVVWNIFFYETRMKLLFITIRIFTQVISWNKNCITLTLNWSKSRFNIGLYVFSFSIFVRCFQFYFLLMYQMTFVWLILYFTTFLFFLPWTCNNLLL